MKISIPKIKYKPNFNYFLEISLIAVIYFFTARLGQYFAIPPGNISAIWIPAGVIMTWMLIRGYHIWPGIFIGAFVGNTSAYIDLSSVHVAILSIIPGIFNGIGDVLCCVVATYLIKKYNVGKEYSEKPRNLLNFIFFAGILGPAISALLGVSSLFATDHIASNQYLFSLVTWFTGDSIAIMIVGPLIISFVSRMGKPLLFKWSDLIFFICLTIGLLVSLSFILPNINLSTPFIIIAPFFVWSVFKQDVRLTSLVIFYISAMSIAATIAGRGPFQSVDQSVNLIQLQIFLAFMIVSILIWKGVVMELQNSINEKELLLKEIHHRVNNNLQVITGLLILQSRTIDSKKVKDLFQQSQYRINTMAMVHEMLYKSDNLVKVDYQEYLKDLTKYLLNSMKRSEKPVHLSIQAPRVKLNVDTSIPLSLLVNEIFTNSLKYGANSDKEDEIYIRITNKMKGNYLLEMGDNGNGFKTTEINKKSLGLKLINGFVSQLNGTSEIDNSNSGTHYKIHFSEIGNNVPN